MDLLIKKRTPVRATFTKLYKRLLVLFEDDKSKFAEIEAKFVSMERIYCNLSEIDSQVLESMLTEEIESDKYNEEFESIEEYKEKYDEVKLRVTLLNQNLLSKSNSATVVSEKSKLKLPKIELTKFSGEVKDWLSFWGQFKRIHENESMSEEDKFHYLIQCMIYGSRAKEIVDSYPTTAENYAKCVDSLKARFGREELLIEYYVRELLGLVVKNATTLKSKINIVQLYDKLESYLRSLESIGMDSDKYAAMLFPLVESCIPEDLLRIWLRNPSLNEEDDRDKSYNNKLTQLLHFLRAEVEGEERISLAKAGFKQNDPIVRKQKQKEFESPTIATANDLVSGTKDNYKPLCVFCGKSHCSKDCFYAQKMTFEEKMEMLKAKKCCYVCLKMGHRAKACRNNLRCIFCHKKHYIIMCPEFKPVANNSSQNKKEEKESSSLSNSCQTGEVLLQTLLVATVVNGRKHILRALIDTGSQCSYILEAAVKRLGLTSTKSKCLTHVVFGGETSSREHKCYNMKIYNLKMNSYCDVSVLDQPIICGPVPCIYSETCLAELRGISVQITDVGQSKRPIELLIGADSAGKIFTGKIHTLKSGLVTMETSLGWVVMGKEKGNFTRTFVDAVPNSLVIQSKNVEDLWKVEAIGIHDPYEHQTKLELENLVRDNLLKTIKIEEDGRYQIKLPWKSKENLHNNKTLSEKRLERTTQKLVAENKLEAYDTVFREWLQENIIEVVPAEEMSNQSCYLPHRGVFKDNHSTTKVRPVFDASSKEKGHSSLNDCLEKGPNTLELIPSILIRFREKKIGVISDIKKAFLQISVCKEDRDFLRFLWWKDLNKREIQVFRHRRVVFGVTSSPFILGAIIQHHLEKTPPAFEDISQQLKISFYVDNCITSVDSEEQLEKFITVSTVIMAKAKMELRGWEHNNINEQIAFSEATPVLGLLWDKEGDTLFCNIDTNSDAELKDPLTRRTLLSFTQKIFDPLGFCCPVTLLPKLLLQESWKERLSWDAELPEDICKKFWNWYRELHLLKNVKIPRYMFTDNVLSVSLHTFCDASGLSYAAVVYVKSKNALDTSVQLVISKSRIAPLNKMSIPRLELMACTIGVRLSSFAKKALNLQNIKEYFWTDSATSLYWIQHEQPWGIFVQNRVKEIRKFSSVNDWRHIPGSENPADLPSRGCSVKKLVDSRWWEGPNWLLKQEREWPESELYFDEEEALKEKKRTSLIVVNESSDSSWLVSYFSSYKKIVRMVGWILRFIFNCRNVKQAHVKDELSLKEIEEAEKRIVRIVQRESFTDEYLQNLNNISYFKDDAGIVRVRTKLSERKDLENFKLPMLLPNKQRLVELLIQERHVELLHCGLNNLLVNLRENFWIIDAKKTIRKIIFKCVRCKRHSSKHVDSAPVPLPEDRVKDASVFEVTGVDLAGPLSLKGGSKCWIVLFTCAVFRAVHLEIVQSLSTTAFLLSLRRFIARRGRPHIIYSDNGTNFIGADHLFKSIDWKIVQREAHIKRIEWKFNPPTAAWWGGFWERLVQVLKKLLRRVLGNACLSYEELMTLIYDCEAIINSRPITYISENTDDLNPLTPGMFLQDIQTVGVPDLDHLDKVNVTKRFRYQQRLREELRRRFRSEYLGQLILPKSKGSSKVLKLGDIVLIENESKRRTFWPLGRVTCIYPGKDNIVRLVKVRTSTGEVLRPVQRLYPLEIELSSDPSKNFKDSVQLDDKDSVKKPSLQHELTQRLLTSRGRAVKLPSRFKDFEL